MNSHFDDPNSHAQFHESQEDFHDSSSLPHEDGMSTVVDQNPFAGVLNGIYVHFNPEAGPAKTAVAVVGGEVVNVPLLQPIPDFHVSSSSSLEQLQMTHTRVADLSAVLLLRFVLLHNGYGQPWRAALRTISHCLKCPLKLCRPDFKPWLMNQMIPVFQSQLPKGSSCYLQSR